MRTGMENKWMSAYKDGYLKGLARTENGYLCGMVVTICKGELRCTVLPYGAPIMFP